MAKQEKPSKGYPGGEVQYTPGEKEVYRLVDGEGSLVEASNRRRTLVAMLNGEDPVE